MQQAEKKVSINAINMNLYHLDYEFIDDSSGDFKFKVNQKLSLKELNDDNFKILVDRHIVFDPERLFKINVSLLLTYSIDKRKTSKCYLENRAEMQDHIEKTLDKFYNASNSDAYLSLIVAQLTGLFGKNPLILPSKIDTDKKVDEKVTERASNG